MATSGLNINQIITGMTPAQVRAWLINILVSLQIPANRWVPGGVLSSVVTVTANFLSMLSVQLSNGIAGLFLPTAVTLAISSGDSSLLILLATYFYGVSVPTATFASGQLTLVNSGGGVYNLAATQGLFSNPNTGVQYTNTTAITIPANSTVTINIEATSAGSAGTSQPGQITNIVTSGLTGVTCSNALPVVGLDAPTPYAIQALCLGALGARSVRGPRTAYAYAISTAVNAVTLAPVNINAFSVSSTHTGVTTVIVAGPSGTDPNDVIGVLNSINGSSTAPLSGARPEGIAVTVAAATSVTYTASITATILAPAGTSGVTIQTAMQTAVTNFFTSAQSNPIGGVFLLDDAHPAGFQGVSASAIYAAMALGVSTIPGCSFQAGVGAVDLAMTPNQRAQNGVQIGAPRIINPS